MAKFILGLALLLLIAFGAWYAFVDTLMLSEVAERLDSNLARTLSGLIDVDTDLTRYDWYRMTSRARDWQEEIEELGKLSDARERERLRVELTEELLQDPAIKKLADRLTTLGIQSKQSLLKALGSVE